MASRDGSVDKDEKLVNCYGEQDPVTKETFVFKRAGIDEGDAVITGNDFYGQGAFSYGDDLFVIIDDILFKWDYVGGLDYGGDWVYVFGSQSGAGGAGGGGYYVEGNTQDYDISVTYDVGDSVIYEGVKYYNHIAGSGVTPGSDAYTWSETPQGAHTYSCNYNSYAGPVCASQDAAAFAAYNLDPAHSCATKNTITPPNYGIWSTDWYRVDNLVYASQWVTFNNCGSTLNAGVVQYGTITQVT
jgi:hypothetical protein